MIFAVDSSADTLAENGDLNWPNGTALIASYKRSFLHIANGTSFPSVPDSNTFVNLGLNSRPTFFGCDAGNTTSAMPLIVYIPNAPYAYMSNVSTFQMAYTTLERDSIIQNGYDVGRFSMFRLHYKVQTKHANTFFQRQWAMLLGTPSDLLALAVRYCTAVSARRGPRFRMHVPSAIRNSAGTVPSMTQKPLIAQPS